MYSASRAEAVKAKIKEEDIIIKEEVFTIKEEEEKPDLATIRPLTSKPVVRDSIQVEPTPSTSRAAVAEVRVYAPPPAQEFKYDPFNLAPRSRVSPPSPPAFKAKRRSLPGGHTSAQPRLKFQSYQARR